MNEREIIIVRFFRKNIMHILTFILLIWLVTDISNELKRIDRRIDFIDRCVDRNDKCLRERLDEMKWDLTKEIRQTGAILWDEEALTRATMYVYYVNSIKIANSLAGFSNDHIKPLDYTENLKFFKESQIQFQKERAGEIR